MNGRERYRALHEHAPVGVLVAVDGTFVFANHAVRGLLGAPRVPVPWDAFVACHVRPEDAPRLADAVREAPEPFRVNVRLLTVDGDEVPVEVTGTVATDGARRVGQFYLRDRRREIEAEREIAERSAQLMRNEKYAALGRLAAGVGHEINNPLAFVQGNEELLALMIDDALARDDIPEEVRADLTEMRECLTTNWDGLQRIRHVVASLRQFSKPSPQRVPVDVNEIVRGAFVLSKPKYKEGRRIDADLAEGALTVVANPDEVGQVILNLLVNAAEACPPDTVVRVRTYRDAAGTVGVDVTDEGPGIPGDVAARIFNPFFTTKDTGTGIGLSISRTIATDHGGDLAFTSKEGCGTTFTLTLPAGSEADAEWVPWQAQERGGA